MPSAGRIIFVTLPSGDIYDVGAGDMTGASASSAGAHGLVPAPAAGDHEKFLKGDGTWANVSPLPAVTSADNGKVLRVVDGAWTATSILSATGVTF